MIYRKSLIVALLLLIVARRNQAINFDEITDNIRQGVGFANNLLGEKGEVPRGNGCVIRWNIAGTLRGFEWKWICTCVDACTGLVEVQTKQSREGSMEHCFKILYSKLAQRGEL